MNAIVYTRYGSPDVLERKAVAKPAPGDNEVLVKVRAVAINDWDWGLLNGTPFINRLYFGLRKPKITILGSDIAGCVEAVGCNVTRLKPRDEVYGDLSGTWGGFAAYVCAPETALALKPADMSFEEAAAIPQAGMLAVQGLIDKGRIERGQKLLINGAGGGVGTFGVQIARTYGAHVTGVDHSAKLDMMRAVGFDEVIDYTRDDFTRMGRRYDLILDAKTDRPVFAYARALNPKGRYVTVGGEMGRIFQALILGPVVAMTTRKKVCIVSLKPNKDLDYMNALFATGKFKPVIDGAYALSEVAEAMRYFGTGRHQGKVVITVDEH